MIGASTFTYLAPFFPLSFPLLPCHNPCSACCWAASAGSSDGPPLRRASSGSSLGWLVCSSTWLSVTYHCDWSRASSCGCACCEDARYAWWRRVLARTLAFVIGAFLCECLYRGGQWWRSCKRSWRKPGRWRLWTLLPHWRRPSCTSSPVYSWTCR